jgi:DNA-binding transcriptional LysR family regulator
LQRAPVKLRRSKRASACAGAVPRFPLIVNSIRAIFFFTPNIKYGYGMEFRDLVYFQAIAESGHLGRAAEQMRRTQPALTKCIRRLEASLDAELFERSGRGLKLTVVGEVLLARARQLRNAVDMTVREVSDVAKGSVGHVRLGSGATTTVYMLPIIYSKVLADMPDVTMELMVGMNDVLRASLRKGYLDLVIGPLTENDHEFAVVPVLEDRVVVVARQGHPLFSRRNIRMADLLQHKWVLPGPQVAMRQWLDRAFLSRNLAPPSVQIVSSSLSPLPQMIAQSDLLSFISVRNLDKERDGASLREVPLPETTMSRWLGVVYRKDVYLSPACHRMIDIIASMSQQQKEKRRPRKLRAIA